MSRIKKIFLSTMLVASTQNIFALTPEQTKGTSLVNNKNLLYQYGIQIGMSYIESHIIENMARYAPEGSIKKLLNGLFNVTGPAFTVTANNHLWGAHITPQIVGKLIKILYINQTPVQKAEDILNKLPLNKKNKEHVLYFIRAVFDAQKEEKATKTYEKNIVLKTLYSFVYKKAKNKNDLKNYFQALGESKAISAKNWDQDFFDVKELNKTKLNEKSSLEEIFACGAQQNWKNTTIPPLVAYQIVSSQNTLA